MPRFTQQQRRRPVGALVFLAAIALSACDGMPSARAQPAGTAVTARLSGAAEVPPVSSQADGDFEGRFDPATRLLRYKVTYKGLSGPATAAHIHGPAMPGANAGVVVPFSGAASPISGEATLTESQAADLTAGKLYVNVHTAANPGGEIRGQLQTTGAGASKAASATGGTVEPPPKAPGGY